jgi:hypothetical protein
MAFGVLWGGIGTRDLVTPVCLPGETPLLMRFRATANAVTDGTRLIAPDALGTWSVSVTAQDVRTGRTERLAGSARGAESVDLSVEAGVPWSGGDIGVLSRAALGLQPEVRNAQFRFEFTLTCGRDDVMLQPMARD